MTLQPRGCSAAYMVVFTFRDQGRKMEFLHRVNIF